MPKYVDGDPVDQILDSIASVAETRGKSVDEVVNSPSTVDKDILREELHYLGFDV